MSGTARVRLGRRVGWVVSALVVALVAAIAWSLLAPSRPVGIDPGDPAKVALGQRVYATHCAACHGARLEGQPDWRARNANGRLPAPPHDDSGHTWHHPDAVLFGITKAGVAPPYAPPGYQSDMPGFGGVLSDDEIWAVLAYIASHWSPQARAHQDRITRQSVRP